MWYLKKQAIITQAGYRRHVAIEEMTQEMERPCRRVKVTTWLSRVALSVVIAAVISSCSSNSLMIRFMYGRMDNNFSQRILNYADFSRSQKLEINRAVDEFFAWHRRNELPRYAEFLGQISDRVETGNIVEREILDVMDKVRLFSDDGFERSPVADSAVFLKNLSDRQVEQIAGHFAEQDKEFFEWFEQRQKQDQTSRRVKSIVKGMSRLGIDLNQQQQDIIREGLDKYEGSPLERFEVWSKWESEFVRLLNNREQVSFEQQVNLHISLYQKQMRIAYPDRQRRNRENSAAIIRKVIENFDPGQKRIFVNKLKQTKQTLLAMSSG